MDKEINNFFYNHGNYNFGDTINDIFFEKLLNKKLNFNRNHQELHYFTTGSVLNMINDKSIICGTGFISDNADLGSDKWTFNNKVINKPYLIISVRGPLTRNKLLNMELQCPENYGDPLLLFPLIYQNFNIKKSIKIGIIPHYIDKNSEKLNELIPNLGESNIKIIDIKIKDKNYQKFIDEILECEYIISSSLHGMMMGLIYNRKTILIEFSNKVFGNLFKFNDFFESLDIKYQVKNIYTPDVLNNIIQIDFNKLLNLVTNMINIFPFINNKTEMIEKYTQFISKIQL